MKEPGVESSYRFARVPEWILFHPDLEPLDIRVYATLDRFDGRECIPAVATIGERIGRGAAAVRTAIDRLVAVGAVKVQARYAEGRQTSNRYLLAGDAPLASDSEERTPVNGGGDPSEFSTPDPSVNGGGMRARRTESKKNEKEVPLPSGFVEFWDLYPRKISKQEAVKAWKQMTTPAHDQASTRPERIIDGLQAWLAFWKAAETEERFMPHAATWLRDARFFVVPPKVNAKGKPKPTIDTYEQGGAVIATPASWRGSGS